jgi:DNA-binding CsgD family transcriptional regulator
MPESVGPRTSGARRLARHVAWALATLVEAAQGGEDASTWEIRLHAPGRDGRWYAVHAVVTEPRAAPRGETVVVTPAVRDDAQEPEAAAAGYGLSPREHDVLSRVARGQATKEIAAALGLSSYTVQDYVRRACEKVGVRTRRELVARVYVGAGQQAASGPPTAAAAG